MEKNETLLEFLDDQLPTYINPMEVQFYLNTDSSLIICSNYPDFEQLPDTSLELFQVVPSVDHLIDLLQLSRPEQLVELTATHLLNLYECGLINICLHAGANGAGNKFQEIQKLCMGKRYGMENTQSDNSYR